MTELTKRLSRDYLLQGLTVGLTMSSGDTCPRDRHDLIAVSTFSVQHQVTPGLSAVGAVLGIK